MYAYHPQFKKKKEKLLAWFLVALGFVLYITSQYPGAPVPGLIQILGVCCLAGSILIVSMYILRSYSYELVEGEDGRIDFVITEHYSRRKTVVCRVGREDIISATPIDPNWKKEKQTVYTYTGVLYDEKRYLLEMNAHGEHFFVIICADETLMNLLTKH
jgi:hypothetical protein